MMADRSAQVLNGTELSLLEVKLKFRLNMVTWQMTSFIVKVIRWVMEILLRIIRVMGEQKVIQRCRVMKTGLTGCTATGPSDHG
jgi:hypothetical protein